MQVPEGTKAKEVKVSATAPPIAGCAYLSSAIHMSLLTPSLPAKLPPSMHTICLQNREEDRERARARCGVLTDRHSMQTAAKSKTSALLHRHTNSNRVMRN
eukprot:2977989-Rhodomonas_salina.5